MSRQHAAVEIQFQLRATGRTPDAAPATKGHLPRVTQVMALAIHFQDIIQRGEARDYADLARLGCLTRERMSQILKLQWLAPDIQQQILEFPPGESARFPISEVAARKIASVFSWEVQREAWNRLRADQKLV
jgi:hypothetical protein